MNISDLSEAEVALVLRHREGEAQRAAAEAFHRKAIATAHAFDDWSEATGQRLTFSTFVNTFGYQSEDGRKMYEAVQRILAAAWPQ